MTKINVEGVIIKPRNGKNLVKYLNEGEIFITYENEDYTHYNISNAINNKCFPIFPMFFSEFKKYGITFDIMSKKTIEKVRCYVENDKRMDIYRTVWENKI